MRKFGPNSWKQDFRNQGNSTKSQPKNDDKISGDFIQKCHLELDYTVSDADGNITKIVFKEVCEYEYVETPEEDDPFGGGGGEIGSDEDPDPCNPDPAVEGGSDGIPIGCGGGGGIGELVEILFDQSFKDTKAECVFNKLNNLSTSFFEAIKKFDGEFPVSHLKFAMDDLGPKIAGQARPPIDLGSGPISPDYVITIAMNSNTTSKAGVKYRPNLMVAKTLAHEVIHAEMFRKLMSLTQKPNFNGFSRQEIIDLLSNGDYPGIYNYYKTYETNWDHQQMSRYYRETIADMLQDFDNYNRSYGFYKDLAWEGLMSNDEYTNVAWEAESDAEQQRIENVILNYIEDNKSEGCQE